MYQLHPITAAALAEQHRCDLLASAQVSWLTGRVRRARPAAVSSNRRRLARQLLAYAR